MIDPVSELASRCAALTPEDRSRLVDLLRISPQEEPLGEVEAAWEKEVERRLSAYDRGEIQPIDGEQVLAEASRLAR